MEFLGRRPTTSRAVFSLPPADSHHWLQWRHVGMGAACIVLTAAILTACLSDVIDSATLLTAPPSITLDFSMIPDPLPAPLAVTKPAIKKDKATATIDDVDDDGDPLKMYEDDEELEWTLVEEDEQKEFANSSDIKCRMGEPDENGFLHPTFDLHDWYLHARATEAKYRWAVSKYNHWKARPHPVEIGRLRILGEYVRKGAKAFPDPHNLPFVTTRDMLRWQAGLKLYKEMSREAAKLEYVRLTRDLLLRYGDIKL